MGVWGSYGFPDPEVFHLAYGDHAGGVSVRYVVEYFPDSFIFDMLVPRLEYVDFEDASDAAVPENIELHLVGFL